LRLVAVDVPLNLTSVMELQHRNHNTRFFGIDLSWDVAKGHIFRAVALTSFAKVVGTEVEALHPSMPYGLLVVECPAFDLSLELQMPLTHRDEFFVFHTLLTEEGWKQSTEDIFVTYKPPGGLLKLAGGMAPRVRAALVPKGQFEKLYVSGRLQMNSKALDYIFTPPRKCWNCDEKIFGFVVRCPKCHLPVLRVLGSEHDVEG
jgi:hypothetical protein